MADPKPREELAVDVDIDIQEILLAASQHDVPKLQTLLRSNEGVGNPANVRDPETGYTPLHAAIAACEPEEDEGEKTTNGDAHGEQQKVVESARETVDFLLQEGAIWNDLDTNNETPGCIAKRLGLTELYNVMVDAGARAEILLNRLDGYEPIEEDEDEDEDGDDEEASDKGNTEEGSAQGHEAAETTVEVEETAETGDPDVTSSRYLGSNLAFQHDRLLDQDQNGVMMAWETEIMAKSAKRLLPAPGLRVLNIGHGMGIIDGLFQAESPSAHHIVEAHPEVVAEMKRRGWHEKPGVQIHEGRWQDVLPALVEQGETFDAIYYDTFAESYADFREFLSEQVIGLLDPDGKWGFFNGMGADRQVSYDVYQKVVEVDLFEAGFDVEWEDIKVPDLEPEWEGVRRKYWVVDNYRLPTCKYMD